MKKSIAILMVAASLISFNASAQCPSKAKCEKAKCEKVTDCKSKADCKSNADKMARPTDPKVLVWEGILLTTDQQAKVDQLHATMKAKKDNAKVEKRKQKMQRDSMARAQRMDERANYLAQLKEILTPEQYTQYLENSAKLQKKQPCHKFEKGPKCKGMHKMQPQKRDK